MKIEKVTPFLVGARPSSDGWSQGQITLFVKLESDEGLIGWGEAYALTHRQRAIREIIIALGAALRELDEVSPQTFLGQIAKPMESKHPGIDYASAVSAIEIALWDLEAKSRGRPLYDLLGGALTTHLPVYANAWDNPVQSPEAIAGRCARLCEEGYRAVKVYPLRQPDLDRAEAVVRLTREAIGPEADLMLDFAVPPDSELALQASKRFQAYNPYWIEEPLVGLDYDGLAAFRAESRVPIVTGERQCGLQHYRNVLVREAADILNPDICGVGISSMLEIGALANAHGAKMSVHNWNSTTVGFLAMLHVSAVMANAGYVELYYDFLELGGELADCGYAIEDGLVRLPQSPGLGVEMREDVLLAMAP